MKRTSVVLGVLGLVYAVMMPTASAQTVLLQDNFDTDAILKSATTWVQGFGAARAGDDTILPWYVRDGKLSSNPPDSVQSSDGTGQNNVETYPEAIQYVLLTGDKAWTDVSFEVKVNVEGANSGQFGLIVRAAPKTKPEDPNTWYEFTYTTNTAEVGEVEGTDELLNRDQAASGIKAPGVVPNLRIYKVVKNKYTLLAETDHLKSAVHIPAINQGGVDHDDEVDGDPSTGNPKGAWFRFVVKGSLLQGFASLDGVKFEKYLEANDGEITAGQVGLTHCEYPPIFDDLKVTAAP
jgi:hypothetical protein